MISTKANDAMPVAKQFHRSLTSFEASSQLKWGKPAFQAFQLRPWAKDSEMEESTKNSLGIFGPQSQMEMGRAKSVPARHRDSMVDRDEVRTAHSVTQMCEAISLKPKASLEALPIRPPLSKMKQIPGRYFPKPAPVETDRLAHLVAFRRNKHPIRIRNYDRPTGNSKSLDMNDLPVESISFLDVIPKSNRQKSPGYGRFFHRMKTSHSEFPEIRSEVFAICFNPNDSSRKGGGDLVSSTLHVSNDNNNANAGNDIIIKNSSALCDPNSELRSDYYTIKRISVTSHSSRAPSRSFSVVLRGQPKRLHPKLLSESGCDFSEDNLLMQGSKSASSSLVGGAQPRDIPDSERHTGSIKPSETSTAPKVKVLAPIMINGLS